MARRADNGRWTLTLVATAILLAAVVPGEAHKSSRHVTTGTARLYQEGGFRLLAATIVDGGPGGVDSGLLDVTRQTCALRSPDCAAVYRIRCAHTLVVLPAESRTHDVRAAAMKISGTDEFPDQYFLRIIDKRAAVDFLGMTTVATSGPCQAEAPRSLVSLMAFHTYP